MQYVEAYSEPCQTSKMERFAKIVNGKKPLTIFAERSVLDVWHDFESASERENLASSSQVLSGFKLKVFSNNSLFCFDSSHYWECLAESYFMKGSYTSALRAFTKAVEVSFFRITAQKMKFSVKDFFSKCDQIRMKLRIW